MSDSYFYGGRLVPTDILDLLTAENQKKIMEHWFRERYEDPAESCPVESGNYFYIWGGPHDAMEVLCEEFSDSVEASVIQELADELFGENPEWASIPTYEDTWLAESTHSYHKFTSDMDNIKSLVDVEGVSAGELQDVLYRLLYANVVFALETYLSDNFKKRILSNSALMRSFVETTPKFKETKIYVSDVYQKLDGMEKYIKEYFLNFIWHRLNDVKKTYCETMKIEFPDIKIMHKAVGMRHKIVHGSGDNVSITRDDVLRIIESATKFVENIDVQIVEKFGKEKESPVNKSDAG